jgi:hypothetical protein
MATNWPRHNEAEARQLTGRFKFLMWLMITGLLAGGLEGIQFTNGWRFDAIILGVAAPMFVIGLIGVCWTWPKQGAGAND